MAHCRNGVRIDLEKNFIVLKGKKVKIPQNIFDEVFGNVFLGRSRMNCGARW
jgi:hypothetical protein